MALYDIGLFFFRLYLSVAAFFNEKIKLGIAGRESLFQDLEQHFHALDDQAPRIQVHVSSYGELEQAKPVIEALKERFPESHIHLTFFSPSGYLHTKGKYSAVDHISYLPFDTKRNGERFLDICRPEIVLFARYDVWHHFARALRKRAIPSILFSATFSDNVVKRLPLIRSIQLGTYESLTHIFCISDTDRTQFIAYGVESGRVSTGGDTRFDQVLRRRSVTQPTGKLVGSGFLHDRLTSTNAFVVVAGSTWKEDIAVIASPLKEALTANPNLFLVVAPHEVSEENLLLLESTFSNTARTSYYNGARVVLVDTIGKLFELYRYASLAYVGGGFGSGVHNTLEPAVWGVPVIVGPNHARSQEIGELITSGGVFKVETTAEFAEILKRLIAENALREEAGAVASKFVEERAGSSRRVIDVAESLLRTPRTQP